MWVLIVLVYGFFLSKSKPTIAIAMIIAITPAAMYVSRSVVVARFDAGAAVGAVVAGNALAWKCVWAVDP